MKKFLLALLLVVFTVGMALTASAATQNFDLYNMTGKIMVSLYIGPSGGNSWRSEDELGDFALDHGAAVAIEFDPWDVARYWDIFVEFNDGSALEYDHFDLFSISKITLKKGGVAVCE
ncbi:MAG: hypothetical protein K5841_09340 [Fretibacterium sp.]|nr:hypothetical protein [Fretibacterium sp.]